MLSSKLYCGAHLLGLSTKLVNTKLKTLPANFRNSIKNYVAITKPFANFRHKKYLTIVQVSDGIDNKWLDQNHYYSKKPPHIQFQSVQGKALLQDALKMRKEILIEKKNVLVKDIQKRKIRVQEKVKEMEEIVERENVLTIPNLLCVGRGLMSPYLGYVIVQGDFNLAMGILAVAGVTDILDGYIARNWPSQASKMGSFLDPMADKLLVGTMVIALAYANLFPGWLCGMVLFRDVFLIGAGFVIRYISLPPPRTISRYFDVTHATAQLEPTFISKINTAVQLIAIGSSLGAPIWNYIDHPALHGLWYFTAMTTVAAAASYIINKDTYKIIKETRQMKSTNNNKTTA